MGTTRTWRGFAVLLTVALASVACGRDNTSSSTTTAKPSSSTATTKAFIDPTKDCTDYKPTQGITGDTIKIGTVRPASGPYSIYDTVTKGIEKFFESQNAKGGIKAGDGKSYKVELVKEDDGYDPARTPALVKKLVEQDGVFALVGDIGTETNLAVRDYLNEKCVPSIALATGSTEWGNAAKYPWYIAGLPSYATEVRAGLDYFSKTKPEAKIALLYQNDDFGKAYQAAIKKYISDTGSKMTVVDEESYDPSGGGTTEAAVVKAAASKADVYFVGIGGTQCPKTLTFIPADWKPSVYVSITCSGKLALSLAGGKDDGIYSAQATLDPSSPTDASNPVVQQYVTDAQAVGLTQSEIEGGIVSAGWGFAAIFAQSLSLAKDVTRAGVMNAAYSMKDQSFPLYRDDVKISTDDAKDPWLIESLRIVHREGGNWVEASPVVDYNGKSNSFAG